MIYKVLDSDMRSILATSYDIGFFASGYEERCTHIPKLLEQSKIARPVVLAFQELDRDEQRQENDQYFKDQWVGFSTKLSGNQDGPIYEILQTAKIDPSKPLRILVDYSSMSRVWYAGILNWARFTSSYKNIILDLVYSVGSHQDTLPPMVISDFVSIPGCEGGAAPVFRSVAVFGLGFEGLAALCVLDRLEPDEVYAYFASPAAFADYPARARAENQELIYHADATLELPLSSVAQTYSLLAELVAPHRSHAEVVMIPMGPKPHVLAAILLSMRFEEIGCLRVSGKRFTRERVQATGEIVSTTVHIRKNGSTLERPHGLTIGVDCIVDTRVSVDPKIERPQPPIQRLKAKRNKRQS